MFNTSILYQANYEATEHIVVNQGGTSCFHSNQLVKTTSGSIPISELKIGHIVHCYNENMCLDEIKPIINILKFKNHKKTIKLKLKNGKEIIATEDHKFLFRGAWVSLKYIVSLLDGNMENDTRI